MKKILILLWKPFSKRKKELLEIDSLKKKLQDLFLRDYKNYFSRI